VAHGLPAQHKGQLHATKDSTEVCARRVPVSTPKRNPCIFTGRPAILMYVLHALKG
jgi:hypothetical protein